MAYLPPDTGTSSTSRSSVPLLASSLRKHAHQAVTNSLSGRFSRGSPVFVISSCEGDGTVPAAVRDLVGRGHEVTVPHLQHRLRATRLSYSSNVLRSSQT